jgi:polysaccharide biosynthesis/export protein
MKMHIFRFWPFLILPCVFVLALPCYAEAQTIPGLTSDQLMKLQQQTGGAQGNAQTIPPTVSSQQSTIDQTFSPYQQSSRVLAESRLEKILSQRAGVSLKLFGYDQLGSGQSIKLSQVGGVQDDYILGSGDEIVISLRGQENAEYRATVDRDGRVVLPKMNPVSAGGRSFGDFKRDMIAAVHRAYVSTEGFVSVGQVRQINVLVSGEVNNAGMRTLNGLATVVDAILVSGGIKKTGSLRHVQILRGGRVHTVDLYGVLTGRASAKSMSLANGDRIVVPSLGPTAAVVGWVRRAGIYELSGSGIGVRELLSLAGGTEVRGKYKLAILNVAPDGNNRMVSVETGRGVVRDSEVLFVQPAADKTVDQATLAGGSALAGQYVSKNTKLSSILKAPGALGTEPYTLFGIISRRDPITQLRTLRAFTPLSVLTGGEDVALQGDDVVRLLSVGEARLLFATIEKYDAFYRNVEDAQRNPYIRQSTQDDSSAASSKTGDQQQASQSQPKSPFENAVKDFDWKNRVFRYQQLSPSAPEAIARQSLTDAEVAVSEMLDDGHKSKPLAYQDMPKLPSAAGTDSNANADSSAQAVQQYPGVSQSQPNTSVGGQTVPFGMGQNPSPLFGERDVIQSDETTPLANRRIVRLSNLALQLNVDPLVLVNFLKDHTVTVDGAVRGPGLYFVGPSANVEALLQAAGGTSRWADTSAIEVTSTDVDLATGSSRSARRVVSAVNGGAAVARLLPHDQVRVGEIFTDSNVGSVSVRGQVRQAGVFQIFRGERLSDVLKRAGGLADNAFPDGTMFLRKSLAAVEQASYQRTAQQIEESLIMAMTRVGTEAKLAPEAFTSLQGYITQLKNQKALGRMSAVADLEKLKANPAIDPLLEDGDVIYIPSKPYSVSVMGEVLQPNAVPFMPGLSASDYVEQAGGLTQFADSSEIFVVRPDGTAYRAKSSWFDFANSEVPAGSTVYVGRDIAAYNVRQAVVDLTSIFSQMATSVAALAVLSNN